MSKATYNRITAQIRNGTAKPYNPPPYRSAFDVWNDIQRRCADGKITELEAEHEWLDYQERDYGEVVW